MNVHKTLPDQQPDSIPSGLTRHQASQLLQQYGPNAVVMEKRKTALGMFLGTLKNPLVIILLVAAIISAFTGDRVSAVLIVAMVSLSSLLDFANSYKSDKAAQELKDRVKVKATVIRDKQEQQIPLEAIVPGDIICLSVGSLVPADGEVTQANHLFLNESSLNGESFPAGKDPGDEVYLGSSVSSGSGLVKVTATGARTKFSHITAALSRPQAPTEFEQEMKSFSFLIIKITFVLVMFVFFVNAWLKGNLLQSLMFAVALAVGLTPEMLPMIITLNLTRGSLAMSRRGVIVKRLSSIQNFGSMDILCTDKTGTLTEDKIEVVKYIDGFGQSSASVLLYASINSHLSGGFHSPLDDAIQQYKKLNIGGYHKIAELPFDFSRRRVSVIVDHLDQRLLIAKGATDEMLAKCGYYDQKQHKLNPATIKLIQDQFQQLSSDGFRLLAVAVRKVPRKKQYTSADEKDMTFLGFIAFLDPPKKSATQALSQMRDHGVGVKIITGDNELVTRKISTEIGLDVTGILLGPQLEKLSDNELSAQLNQCTIFARVTPEQKMRIITLLKANGHVVGYIGDGINDAPSLKAADVGISVNNAVDIAKDSADLILLHKSLEDLIQGVIQGRKTYANTMKYIRMALSSNFGNVFSMAGASLILPFLPMLPTQILFNNLLYDTSQFTIPLDSVDPGDILKPQKLRIRSFKNFMFIFGPLSSIFDFITFAVLILGFHATQAPFQTGWFVESMATQVFVIYVIRTRRLPFIHSWPHPALLCSTLAIVAVGIYIALTPLGHFFSFVALPSPLLLSISLIVAGYLVAMEGAKRLFYHWIAWA